MWNAGLDEAQAGIEIARRNINNLRYEDDSTIMAESKEEPKSFLMKVKEQSKKSWLTTQHSENEDHGIRAHHFMANRWGNSERLYLFGSKITADGSCSHEIMMLAPLKKSYDQPNSISKSRDITLPKTIHLVKVLVFPVVMYGCESLTIKKAEFQRIDAFEL